MKKFLVDTDVIIWYLKGRDKEVEFINDLKKEGKIFISVISLTEVVVGLTKNKKTILRDLKEAFIPLEVSVKIAELAGNYKQKYRLAIADMLIAATSAITKCILVTYNRKHFPMREIEML